MFEPMPYLEWIEGRPEAADHDLGSSDLRKHRLDGSVTPPPLAGLPDPDDPPFEHPATTAIPAVPRNVRRSIPSGPGGRRKGTPIRRLAAVARRH